MGEFSYEKKLYLGCVVIRNQILDLPGKFSIAGIYCDATTTHCKVAPLPHGVSKKVFTAGRDPRQGCAMGDELKRTVTEFHFRELCVTVLK